MRSFREISMEKKVLTLSLIFFLCFFMCCRQRESPSEYQALKTQAEIEKRNKEIVTYALKLYDEKNFEERDKLFSPDTLYHAPGGKEYSLLGYREEFGIHFYNAFPDLSHTIDEILADGDKVVLRLTDYGTHLGEFMGIPPTGKKVQWPVTSIYRLKDSIIQELWIEFDLLSLKQKLIPDENPGVRKI
jgi:predicted ester cyclase